MLFWGLDVLVVALLLVANGIFAMSELAIISARKARLQQWAEEGDANARSALELAGAPSDFLSTVQIGITLVGVLSGAFGGVTLSRDLAGFLAKFPLLAPYSESLALGLVVVAITYLTLLAELAPKRLALYRPERIAVAVAKPMRLLSVIASPVIRMLSCSTDLLLRVGGVRPSSELPVTEEEIKILIEQAAMAGVLAEVEQDMMERVFRLGDRQVGILMTPRSKIVWLDNEDPPEKNRRKMSESRHSRFLVCQGRLGNILGIVQVKDLLARSLAGLPFDLKASLRQPLFVLESMQVLKVLDLFRETGTQMALVVDEYGTIEGMVTLNDFLEAIMGEMPSSDTAEEPRITERADGSWLVDGMLPADELKEMLHLRRLPGEKGGHYQTLGGFVMTVLGRIPKEGDHFATSGFQFEVVDMDGRRVDKVLVSPMEPESAEDGP